MLPAEFLYSELDAMAREFPSIHIKYAYNSLIRTHIVVLLPVEEYHYNKALDDRWMPFSFRFREIFVDEEIAFVSADSVLDMDGPTWEWNRPELCFNVFNELFSEVADAELNYYFTTSASIETLVIGSPIKHILSFPSQELPDYPNSDSFYLAAA